MPIQAWTIEAGISKLDIEEFSFSDHKRICLIRLSTQFPMEMKTQLAR